MERYQLNTFFLLNRPVRAMGLPVYWFIPVPMSLLFVVGLGLYWMLPVYIIGYLFLKKISEENKNGHPDYLLSIMYKYRGGKYFVDTDNLLSILNRKDDKPQ